MSETKAARRRRNKAKSRSRWAVLFPRFNARRMTQAEHRRWYRLKCR